LKLLDDHVVLVTGGGSGLGLGVARHLLTEGAHLAVLEVDPDKVKALSEEFGDSALVLQGDVRNIGDLQDARSAIVERFGRLTSIVATQGIWDGNVPLVDIPVEQIDALFDEVYSINVKGYVLTAKVFLDLIQAERGGLVLTASQAAFAADGGGTAYTSSKGAVRSLVNQLAFELGPEIRVNAVAPTGIAKSEIRGPAALGLEQSKQSDIPADAFRFEFEWLTPLQHLPSPEEYGPLYAFLASRHNTVMTGQTLIADSGTLNRALGSMTALVRSMPDR
jgi:NAD(P)-dependent dehydrogenase (short-subunit alcohol dehydrogenase family)